MKPDERGPAAAVNYEYEQAAEWSGQNRPNETVCGRAKPLEVKRSGGGGGGGCFPCGPILTLTATRMALG